MTGFRPSFISSNAATRRFYTDVARWAADRGWLRLAFLRVDGTPLAFDFALEADGVHYLLKTGFVEAARALAPGVVLRFWMVRRAFQLGLTRYELLGTVDGTRRLADGQRVRVDGSRGLVWAATG